MQNLPRLAENFKNQYVTSADLALPPNGSSQSVKILTSVCIYLRPDRSTGLLDIPKWGSEARLGPRTAEMSISFLCFNTFNRLFYSDRVRFG